MNAHSFFLLLNKEKSISSNQALGKVKRLLSVKKAGYCGTLDPLAEGLLIIAVGKATRLIRFATFSTKSYSGTMKTGISSNTYDNEGDISPAKPVDLNNLDIPEVEKQFTGTISQVPPRYSALKINGRRAYDMARKGEEFTLQAREVEISSLKLSRLSADELNFNVACSSGTYIRSLVHDIGVFIGSDAVMTSLVRDGVGRFSIKDAFTLSSVKSSEDIPDHAIISVEDFISHLPRIDVQEHTIKLLRNGTLISELDIHFIERYCVVYFQGKPEMILEKDGDSYNYCVQIA